MLASQRSLVVTCFCGHGQLRCCTTLVRASDRFSHMHLVAVRCKHTHYALFPSAMRALSLLRSPQHASHVCRCSPGPSSRRILASLPSQPSTRSWPWESQHGRRPEPHCRCGHCSLACEKAITQLRVFFIFFHFFHPACIMCSTRSFCTSTRLLTPHACVYPSMHVYLFSRRSLPTTV